GQWYRDDRGGPARNANGDVLPSVTRELGIGKTAGKSTVSFHGEPGGWPKDCSGANATGIHGGAFDTRGQPDTWGSVCSGADEGRVGGSGRTAVNRNGPDGSRPVGYRNRAGTFRQEGRSYSCLRESRGV